MAEVSGPTQYREAVADGTLPPAHTPFTDSFGGVNVTQAMAEAGGQSELSRDDAEAVMAVVRGEADVDSVKKDTLVAFIEFGNSHLDEDDDARLSTSGNKEELVERLRGAYNS